MGVPEPTVRKMVTRAGRFDLIGSGDPEGEVDGPFAATFRRLDGAPGSSLYVKESGEGNVHGWRAL